MAAPSKKKQPLPLKQRAAKLTSRPINAIKKNSADFLSRRPHRSFRLTRRRDYTRSLKLPGYVAFTHQVNLTLKQHKRTFLLLAIFYMVLSGTIVGLASQDTYDSLVATLNETGSQLYGGDFSQVGQAGLVLLTVATAGLTQNITDVQQVYSVLLGLMVWLTTVWLLRNLIAGHKVKLRDGLYNASAPLISTFLICLVITVQALPFALVLLGYSAAANTGLLNSGVEAMLFWLAAMLLTVFSLYLIVSSFFALIISTLPGMYPMRALRAAGDLVTGRRIRILLRLLWMGLCIVIAWIIVMIPMILLDNWIKATWPDVEWLPIIPVFLLIMTTLTIIWAATYIYLLYRKVVDDDAKPA